MFGAYLHRATFEHARGISIDFRKAKLNATIIGEDISGNYDSALLFFTQFMGTEISGTFRGAKVYGVSTNLADYRHPFLVGGAILIDSLGNPLPDTLQNIELYE